MPKKNLPDSRLNLTHFIQKRLHSKAANAKKEKKCTTRNLQNFYSRYTFRAQKPESKNVQRLAFAKIFRDNFFCGFTPLKHFCLFSFPFLSLAHV